MISARNPNRGTGPLKLSSSGTSESSLSEVGSRIFASFARTVMARANPREVELRRAIEQAVLGAIDHDIVIAVYSTQFIATVNCGAVHILQ